MSFEIQEQRRFSEESQARAEAQRQRKAAPAPKAPTTASRELKTLADPSASDVDRFKAWIKIGLDLGAVELRHVDRLGVVTR